MTAYLSRWWRDPVGPLSFSILPGPKLAGIVSLNGDDYIECSSPEEARDIAHAFTKCAELMEARQREAAHAQTLDVQP